ncbi:molecular chaperone DnaJ [Rhodococcus sp. 05-2255-3B1]|uniref:molecular chaperone DnaJ n=1 Tax=unclassified Rhodococcus (in: high G+C Gram-positive bacteria) TaxID=192944 RepID=UPI000B9BF392|nr:MULTISPECIES: molecular chaperone DnaJ [unclassified Rhodococcus (in: high G+C Gram-positive bacteria)]OZE13345.1 molecular chaperone DnaJ [Rhodococcus sp. 05-2255-3C]OZE16043.1 molecular chaperone DnaJ [Rhodococcus sp. 05-2255-3B1]OZE19083.1 molecular chaperone DnaJ [Rhodococcus sp. 05-2255-2A2]
MTEYPTNLTLRPIVTWPGKPTAVRERSKFSATWSSTLSLLDRELSKLGKGARNAPAVLQIAMREQDFRQDGMPRANARPEHPGVILAITDSIKGPLSFPCDKYDLWQDNLRAIALSLEDLRAIDRHGVTQNAEQYVGWKAIESTTTTTPLISPEAAEEVLRTIAGDNHSGLELGTLAQVYRRARRNAHPDRHGGDRLFWNKVEAAAAVLDSVGRLR